MEVLFIITLALFAILLGNLIRILKLLTKYLNNTFAVQESFLAAIVSVTSQTSIDVIMIRRALDKSKKKTKRGKK